MRTEEVIRDSLGVCEQTIVDIKSKISCLCVQALASSFVCSKVSVLCVRE